MIPFTGLSFFYLLGLVLLPASWGWVVPLCVPWRWWRCSRTPLS